LDTWPERASLSPWKVEPPTNAWSRYETLLPLRFNDGQPVPSELLGECLLELETHFSAISWETQIVRGRRQYQGRLFRDELRRVFVDVEDSPEHRQFILDLKQRLKARFDLIDVWVTVHPITAL